VDLFVFGYEELGLMEDLGKADKFTPLGWFHGADKRVSGRCLQDSDQVLNCGSEKVSASEFGEGPLWKPCELAYDSDLAGVFGPNLVTSVVFEGWADIPPLKCMRGPCAALCRFKVGKDLDAWWCNRMGIKIISAVDLFPCRQVRVDARSSEEIEGEFGLWNRFIPKVHGEAVVCGVPAGCEMVLCRSDGSFGRIAAMVIGWGKLICHIAPGEVVLEMLGTLIVQAMEQWPATSFGEGGVDISNGCSEGFGRSVFDGSQEDRIAIKVVCDEEVVVSTG
jgi:hypothetical protein